MRSLLDRLTYANVVATLALFIAVGTGGAYAVSKIDGSDIRNRSLTGREFKANSIGGKVIRSRACARSPARRTPPASPASPPPASSTAARRRSLQRSRSGTCASRPRPVHLRLTAALCSTAR